MNAVIEVSNRKILFGLIEELNLSEKFNEIATALDKIDKIGKEEVEKILTDLGVVKASCEKLISLVSTKGDFDEINKALEKLSSSNTFKEGLLELKQIDSYLKDMGAEGSYLFNLAIIRGHNYYTGSVFEAYLSGLRQLGAVGGGGRYDNLAEYFTDKKLPGVGMSIGMSRLFDLCVQNNLLKIDITSKNKASIIPLGDTLSTCLKICNKLRSSGINCEVLFEDKSFKSKLKDANRSGVPFVIIVGEEEVSSQKFAVKNMQTGEQNSLTTEEIIKLMR